MRFRLFAVLILVPAIAQAQPAPRIAVENFAALPVLRSPQLSPNGLQIAAKAVIDGKNRLALLDADKPTAIPRIFDIGDYPASAIHWAGNSRLLVEIATTVQIRRNEIPVSRMVIIDVATGAFRVADRASTGLYGGDVLYVDPSGDWAMLASQNDIFSSPSIKRVDLATGDATVVEKAKANVWDWFVDDKGVVRGGVAYDERRWKLWYRSVAGEAFRTITGKFDKDDDSAVDNFYFSRAGDTGTIVTNQRNGRFGAYEYNFATGETGKAIYEHPEVDISAVVIDRDSQKIIGVRFHDDRWKTNWLDPKLKALQSRIDRALPSSDNQIIGDQTKDNRLLIRSSGASDPGTYFLFDQAKGTIGAVVQPFSKIDRDLLVPVEAVRYRARDGLEIRGYLTLPKGKGASKLPLILLPHGGPFVRDEWTYDPLVQFLANRGYAVFQPQFRGSTGFGKSFVERGYGEWGRKMQDDLDDGVDWLAASGKIDPKRVCIAGASYGGYAALWGAIRNPERYRCAASLAGVTDLDAQLRDNRQSFSATRYFKEWRTKVKGEGQFDLKQVSPLAQAARLKVPVFVAHGEKDQTVLVKQGKAMVEALQARKADVTAIFYKEAGHDFSRTEDLADFLKRLEAFFAKHNPA